MPLWFVLAAAAQDKKLEDLIARARALPPEFAADALIRIAQSGRIAEREWIIEVLEDAFHAAANAQQPFRRTQAVALEVERRSTYLSHAFDFSLDTLSLQGRAMLAMRGLDRRKARELAREIPPPRLPRLSCEDSLVYQISDLYDMLAQVAERGFTPQEKARDLHVRFLEPYIAGIDNPVQLAPAMEVLFEVTLTPDQFRNLLSVYVAALESMDGDSRSFGNEVGRHSMLYGWVRLAIEARKRGVGGEGLLLAVRKFLVRHLSVPRCAAAGGSQTARDFYVAELNKVLTGEVSRPTRAMTAPTAEPILPIAPGAIPPITPEEIKPGRVEGAVPKEARFWESLDAKSLQERLRKLRARPAKRSEAEQAQWEQDAAHFITDLEGWTAAREPSAADHFHQKSMLYAGLLDGLPPGPARANLYRLFVTFLSQSELQHESRIEWFWHANNVVNRIRSSRPEDRAEMDAVLANAQNPVLLLYRDLFRELEAKK